MSPINQLQYALNLADFDPRPAQLEMVPTDRALDPPPPEARLGAVLLLLYPKTDARETHIVFAKRPDTMRDHPGQVAFPGGRHEPGETFAETALRETEEELGISPAAITLIGGLRPVYVPPSNFYVHPFVGWHPHPPLFVPSPREVDHVIEVPLRYFRNRHIRGVDTRLFGGQSFRIPYFQVAEHKVWGATATILNELVARLAAVERQPNAK